MTFSGHLVLWNALLAQAAQGGGGGGGGAEQAPGGGLMSMLPMFIAFIAIMYFLLIRPQQKREKERREMLSALSKGDTVVTSGGICGTIQKLTDEHVILKVDENVKLKMLRSAVAQVVSESDSAKEEPGEDTEE